MSEAEARTAVQATLAVLSKIAERTRTPIDNLMVEILRTSEAKLAAAILELVNDTIQPPTPERVVAALRSVGIQT